MDEIIIILVSVIGIGLVLKFMKGCVKAVVILAILFFVASVLLKIKGLDYISQLVSKFGEYIHHQLMICI